MRRAEAHGVFTFYHHFRNTPPGRHPLKVCRAQSCQSMGAEGLAEHAMRRLGVGFDETTSDGAFSLRPVYCLGNCACSPAVMIGGDLFGRATPQAARRDPRRARADALSGRSSSRFPPLLRTGRSLTQYNVGAHRRRTENRAWQREDLLEIHPHDAEERGVPDGERVGIERRCKKGAAPA